MVKTVNFLFSKKLETMKFIYKIFGILLVAVVSFTSCKKDINQFNPTEITAPDFSKMVKTDIGGTITDDAGEPVKDVEITIGSEFTTTDENGVFLIKNVTISARKAYVKATKSGYFHGSRTMYVEEGKLHFANIQILEKTNVGNFQSTTGGTISFQGVEMVFPANGIKLKDGGMYSGSVNVLAKYLSPDDSQRNTKMPGDLRGINTEGEEIVMATFGMTAVELIGDSGEELQVADDTKVAMSTPVPASFVSLAPSTIPLWFFDEADGLWKEEGEAVLEGNNYVGSVSHFTWWNNDFPYPAVDIKGQILDEDGNPLAGVHVNIRVVGEAYGGHGDTNADGVFCGGGPKGKEIELTIVGNSTGPCGGWNDPVFTVNLGIITEPTILPPITLIPNGGQGVTPVSATISGRLIDCDDNPVSYGYVEGLAGGRRMSMFVEDDGTFSYTGIFCSPAAEIIITGYDLENALQTELQTFPFDANVSLGDLKACDQLEHYVTYTLDGSKFTIPNPTVFGEGRWTYLSAWGTLDSLQGTSEHISFAVDQLEPMGTFPIATFDRNGQLFSSLGANGFQAAESSGMEVTYTRYDADQGGTILGIFSETFEDTDGNSHTLTGEFRALRKD